MSYQEYKVENIVTDGDNATDGGVEEGKVKLTIEVSAEDFEKAMEKSYLKNRGKMSVQGFRKGKVPRNMIEKMYGPEVFYEDAANFIIPEAYIEVEEASKLDIIARPEIDIVDIGKGKPFKFTAIVTLKPEVTLGTYKGVEVEKREAKVLATEINEEIEKIQEQNARMISIDSRNIEENDIAIIDFEGFVDGVAFDGGKGENHELTIGSHSFIDTFEEQLIGKAIGDELDINVTFPEDYHAEALKGKPALFKVKVKEIKNKELPEVDDDFASEISEFETLKEYKASIKKELTEKKKEEIKSAKELEVVEKVVENATMNIPEVMIIDNIEQMAKEFARKLQQQGLNFDQYMQLTGMNMDSFKSQMRPEALKRIKTRLTLEKIVEQEGIKATQEDIDKEISDIASMYQMDIDKVKDMLGENEVEQISLDMAVQKAVDFVVKEAIEVEAKVE